MRLLPFHSHVMLNAGTVPAALRTTTMPAKPKVKKLLRKVRGFLDDNYKDQLKQADSMQKVLKKLKSRQKWLEKQAESDDSSELQDQIRVVKAQRKKGLSVLKKLMEDRMFPLTIEGLDAGMRELQSRN